MSAVLFAVALRVFMGLGGHSGRNSPPMHGDFEAQRHWMELTTALPSNAWYSFVTLTDLSAHLPNRYSYDLAYWGLDYPPLTALHSYVAGVVGKHLTPESFEVACFFRPPFFCL